ncbi:MAG: rRNA maturation RNase YbeY [Cyanophyceae cyanobacterium]
MDSSAPFSLYVEQRPTAVPLAIAPETWETWFQRWWDGLTLADLSAAGEPLEIAAKPSASASLILVDDAEIHQFNQQYRQIDRPTDVLAFALLDGGLPPFLDPDEPLELGDVVISLETADRQARDRGHPLDLEVAWLATHGLLHLAGWDHPDDAQLQRMLDRQRQLLHASGHPIDALAIA